MIFSVSILVTSQVFATTVLFCFAIKVYYVFFVSYFLRALTIIHYDIIKKMNLTKCPKRSFFYFKYVARIANSFYILSKSNA